MKKVWFKKKSFGWGWYPVSWEGWLVTLGFAFLAVWNFYRIDSKSHSVSDTLINFIPETILLTIILVFICYKTGEKL
jgi:hypothetical protein